MTTKIAFLFPGQGAQEVGMGRDLFGRDAFADQLVARASEAAGYDIAKLCTRGPARRLADTAVLQPALAALSLALWYRLKEAGIRASVTAGHSLGELPAMAASGIADPPAIVALAAERGRCMAEASSRQRGSMLAATGIPVEDIEAVLEMFKYKGVASAAAINAPTQMTVSGDVGLLDEIALALRARAGKVKRLRVSGAWHSEHMCPATVKFRDVLEALEIRRPEIKMVFNRDGREVAEPNQIRERIAGQLVRPIRWDLVMARLLEIGITDFIEIGPGRILRGLVRLNSRDSNLVVHNVSDRRSLERTVESLLRN